MVGDAVEREGAPAASSTARALPAVGDARGMRLLARNGASVALSRHVLERASAAVIVREMQVRAGNRATARLLARTPLNPREARAITVSDTPAIDLSTAVASAFITAPHMATPNYARPSDGTRVEVDPAIPPGLQRSFETVAAELISTTPPTLRPDSTIVVELPPARAGSGSTLVAGAPTAAALYRFTWVRTTTANRRRILVEPVASGASPVRRSGAFGRFSGSWGSQQGEVDRALTLIPPDALALLPNDLDFIRDRGQPPLPGEGGYYDSASGAHGSIRLFDRAFSRNATRYGSATDLDSTVAHEVGHALQHHDRGVLTAFGSVAGAGNAITVYGRTNDAERFAEAFSQYVVDPAELERLRPAVFRFFQTRYGPRSTPQSGTQARSSRPASARAPSPDRGRVPSQGRSR